MKLNKNIQLLFFTIIVSAFIFCSSCTNNEESSPPPQAVKKQSPTFTFFDVGNSSVLSKSLRKNLSNILGDDSVETRSTIDLKINNRKFFKETFPYFQALNQKLNSRTDERVEHDTINIIFRYARTKNLPLDYVGFLFSKRTKYPLLIKVHFKNDDLNIIKTLYERYGTPESIPWKQENGKSLCWKKAKDILVVSFVPDEFGNPEYEIVIYFANALENLITTEQQNRQQNFLESGKKVF